ncbi:hypothetical protein FOQG_14714 [Fusarium oxysporum f. sp. raphani 54005]|uniref:FAD-binding domain-containing protein n=1 Tax=Fusarium oxysporum f. sp. raphani 54005 TaxID=1089458 RepID=X0BPE8_FUSOX|nr:hypothetical protein FOQG_14714 [Fusarium oxysporum f. sp. raphani 54005]
MTNITDIFYLDETMMMIHFSANLREVVGDRLGMLHWFFRSPVSGFTIACNLSGNAVLNTHFDFDKYPVDMWNKDLCQQVLKGAIGKDMSPKVLSYRPWILSQKVAKAYREGNVFLTGDAAHSFPPTGGLGLNSSCPCPSPSFQSYPSRLLYRRAQTCCRSELMTECQKRTEDLTEAER